MRVPWSLLTRRRNHGVEVRYLVTAELFEQPEDDWLSTASSRARVRVEVIIRKLSSGLLKAERWISGSAMIWSRLAKEQAFPKNES